MREHFFGPDPRLQELVAHLSDDDLAHLRRGGHDLRKVYAAYDAATKVTGQPTVILAKTVKGWTLGTGVEGRNITHQAKKMTEQELKVFRDRLQLRIPDADLKDAPYYHPGPKAPEIEYLLERRAALGGPMPRRVVLTKTLDLPADPVYGEFMAGSGTQEASTTMAFARLLRNLLRDKVHRRPRSCRSSPTRRAPSAWTRCSRRSASTRPSGSCTSRSTRTWCSSYREAKDGQVLEEGITEAGSSASFQAAGTAYATHGEPMIPFYIFYSMFGFQRTGDEFWAFADARGRGFLLGATAGRTTLNGEGLQHEDGHSLILASVIPTIRIYDPAFAYETAVIVRDGIERMYGAQPEDVFYYLTLYNENHVMPARPADVSDADIVRGLYRFRPAPDVAAPSGNGRKAKAPLRATILAGGAIMQQALRAQEMLAESSAWRPTCGARCRTSCCATRRSRSSAGTGCIPTSRRVRRSSATCCASRPRRGPIIAVSDFISAWPDMICALGAGRLRGAALGTDGFGRSDTREALRRFFEVDAEHIVRGDSGRAGAQRSSRRKRGTQAHRRARPGARGGVRTALLAPAPPMRLARWALLAVVLASFGAACQVCADNSSCPPLEAIGVVTAVDGPDLAHVDEFTLRTPDGKSLRFRVGTLHVGGGDLPAAHLREHLVSGEPVRVFYYPDQDTLVAIAYSDAAP